MSINKPSTYEKMSIVAQERSDLRSLIISMMLSVQRTITLFFTLVAGIVALLISREPAISEMTRIIIVVIVSQLTVLLGFFLAMFTSVMGTLSGYLKVLEEDINIHAGECIVCTSRLISRLLDPIKSTYSISVIGAIVLIMLHYAIAIIYVCWQLSREYLVLSITFGVIASLEGLFVVYLVACAQDKPAAEEQARNIKNKWSPPVRPEALLDSTNRQD